MVLSLDGCFKDGVVNAPSKMVWEGIYYMCLKGKWCYRSVEADKEDLCFLHRTH